MNLKVLLDMNLSPNWVDFFESKGLESVHWSSVGNPKATDREIMDYAGERGYVVLTHDLDVGTTLALTHSRGAKRHSNP